MCSLQLKIEISLGSAGRSSDRTPVGRLIVFFDTHLTGIQTIKIVHHSAPEHAILGQTFKNPHNTQPLGPPNPLDLWLQCRMSNALL